MRIECSDKEELISWVQKVSLNKKLYIFAAGTYGNILGIFFNENSIAWEAYIDNNKNLVGQKLNQKDIKCLEEIQKEDNFVYIISAMLYENIKEQLEQTGVKSENIYWFGNMELLDEIGSEFLETRKHVHKIERFKNIHQGKRCFLIGNGPSLVAEDLNKIKNEYSMAANKIFQAFPNTEWRPTYYFCDDSILCRELFAEKEPLQNVLSVCEAGFSSTKHALNKYHQDKDITNLYYYESRNTIDKAGKLTPLFSDDCGKCVYACYTIVYIMYQIAVYMGFKELYLLGMDFSFTQEVNQNGQVVLHDGIKRNHSNLMDELDMKKENMPRPHIILEGHKMAKNYAESHGVKIYNATRGGKLEVFERVDLDSLFE